MIADETKRFSSKKKKGKWEKKKILGIVWKLRYLDVFGKKI